MRGLEHQISRGRWKIGPRDSEVQREMRAASRRGRITAAERRDYEAMRRREAQPWVVRQLPRFRKAVVFALILAAIVVGVLVFQALLTALVQTLTGLITQGLVPVLIVLGCWVVWSVMPHRRRRRTRRRRLL